MRRSRGTIIMFTSSIDDTPFRMVKPAKRRLRKWKKTGHFVC